MKTTQDVRVYETLRCILKDDHDMDALKEWLDDWPEEKIETEVPETHREMTLGYRVAAIEVLDMLNALIDSVVHPAEWTRETPTEAGPYWFCGARNKNYPDQCGTDLVHVKAGAGTKLFFVMAGHFMYEKEWDGVWMKATLPAPPSSEEVPNVDQS